MAKTKSADGSAPAASEMEITDVNNANASEGNLTYAVVHGWWTDAGTFKSLEEAGKRLKGVLP